MSGRPGAVAFNVALAVCGLALLLGPARADAAGPPDDRILPVDQYTSQKARALAQKYASALRELSAGIYHCMPWVEVKKEGIGFYRPKGSTGDERHLSLNIYIEQEPSSEFAKMQVEERGSRMFSRYVGPLLGRMTHNTSLLSDPLLDGFTVILSWLKQAVSAAGGRPIHETIAAFIEKASVAGYLTGRLPVQELAARARVLAWDGETPLGPLRLSAWDDNFVTTYKVKNYEPEPGAKCP